MKALARLLLVVGLTIAFFPSTPAHINNSVQQGEVKSAVSTPDQPKTVQAKANETIPNIQEPSPQPQTEPKPERPLTDKQKLMQAAGIPEEDWNATDYIVSKESSWRHTAWGQPTKLGRAYGLCQSLPASKMASAGGDYLTNPVTQLKWCHRYAHSRYGGWWKSFAFWRINRWW